MSSSPTVTKRYPARLKRSTTNGSASIVASFPLCSSTISGAVACADQVVFDLCGGERAPVAAVVGPEHDRIAEALRDLAAFRRCSGRAADASACAPPGSWRERPEHVAPFQNLPAHFVGVLLVEVRMRVRVIGDLVAFGFDARA